MVRVRFAPSPSGSLHLGGALTAVANRRFADERDGTLVLRIDDTDAARREAGAEEEILAELAWLGVRWDEGPIRQSERGELYRAAAERLVGAGEAFEDAGAIRLRAERRPTLVRPDGTATYHLATVVDDADLGITHVIRGKDQLPNTPLHELLARALGAEPPVYVHHGLLLGPDGAKLSKRHGAASIAALRELGIPAAAVRAYLEELDLPRSDLRLDEARLRRLAIDAIRALPDGELAALAGAPVRAAPALRGSRTLVEARATAAEILSAPPATPAEAPETLERFRELLERGGGELDEAEAHALVRELKAVGGDLRALRLALTGRTSGPELWSLLVALPPDEALRRVTAALAGDLEPG